MNTLAILLSDTYKQCHPRMYPDKLERLVSYWVPRRSMFPEELETMVWFGFKGFVKEYLIDYFKKHFFDLSEEVVAEEYKRIMDIQIGADNYDLDLILNLHKLGFLPLKIKALPEGTKVPMGVPCIEITNTIPEFAWVVQWIECVLQSELWKPCFHATIGDLYYQEAKRYYDLTVEGLAPEMACADFGMRGMSGLEEAIKCSAAWMLSFNKTSTIPAIDYIEQNYDIDCGAEGIGLGGVSVEHSVVSAWYALHGDEASLIEKLLVKDYPNSNISYVADTYDYWNNVEVVIPSLKDVILKHNGKFLVRPDSGNMVEIAVKTVKSLWDSFGGTINSKGYKVLDPHIGVIYGDGCTLQNVRDVWSALAEAGFAANNIFYGVGAFCFTAVINGGKVIVGTRDTFGIAMKATYAEVDGQQIDLFKDPKTDTSKLKKSHKGCIKVKEINTLNGDNFQPAKQIIAKDGYKYSDVNTDEENLLGLVFIDGQLVNTDTFIDIRNRLHGGNN
jgi:nicotinamide phosphoribosyltransferase